MVLRQCLYVVVAALGWRHDGAVVHWRRKDLEPALKALSKAMRHELARAVDQHATPRLSGGRKGRPMSIVAMTVEAHLAKLRRSHLPGGILFLDGISAFYTTSRYYLCKSDNACCVEEWVDGLNLGTAMKERVMLLLSGPTYCFKQYVMIVAIDTMVDRLEEAGLRVALHCKGVDAVACVAHALVPTWLDDVAILMQTRHASLLAEEVCKTTVIAFESLQMIGVALNFEQKKTETVVHFAGPGVNGAKHEVLVERDSQLDVCLSSGTVHLRCVRSYLHLSTTASGEGSHVDDVDRRRQLTEACFGPVYTRLLFSAWLTAAEKTSLLQTLMLNKFCHGAGVWRLDSKKSWASFKAAYMSFVRRSLGRSAVAPASS